MIKRAEYRLGGVAILFALLCFLGMNASVQNYIINMITPLIAGVEGEVFKFGKFFTQERLTEYMNRCLSVLLQLEVICILLYLIWRKAKNRILVLQGEFSPFILLGVGMFLLHIFLILNWGDDLYFKNAMHDNGFTFLLFLSMRYNQWSSRLFIETLLVLVAQAPILWWFLDTAIIILVAYSLHFLLPDMTKGATYLLVCLIFTYPFVDMRTAGWIAATMNYIWPLGFGLYAMVSIKRILQGKEMKTHHYVLSVLALLYAANYEQMGALLVGFFGFFALYQGVVQKKVPWFLLVQALISVTSVVLILIAPGNEVRTAWTIDVHFPSYVNLSFFDKFEMGFSSTLFGLVMKPDLSFFLFALLVFLAARVTRQSCTFLTIASVPLFFSLVFGLLGPVFGKLLPFVGSVRGAMTETGTNPSFSHPMSLIPDLLLIVVCLSGVITLYRVFAVKRDAWLVLLVLGAGFASRIIIAFTPSIWFSGGRTFIYLYFALIYCSVRLFQVILFSQDSRIEKIGISAATVIAGLSWLFNIMVGCVTHMPPL